MTRVHSVWLGIALAIACTAVIRSQPAPSTLRGSWSATVANARTLRGGWTATIDSAARDSARGSWVLVDDGNRVVLQGTWSAEKSARGWQGSWAARAAPPSARTGRESSGRTFSGTWGADLKDPNVRTLADLFQKAVVDQVAGTWRSGSLGGGWRLTN